MGRRILALAGLTLLLGLLPTGVGQPMRDPAPPPLRPLAQVGTDTTFRHARAVGALAWSPDGKWLATGGDDEALALWDGGTYQFRRRFDTNYGQVRALAWSPASQLLAAGYRDEVIVLWDVARGQERATLRGHSNTVTCLAFTPDGRFLASGSSDNSVRLWDVAQAVEVRQLPGHRRTVMALAFAPDGRQLVTAGQERLLRIWDTATWVEQKAIRAGTSWIRCLAYSPEGRFLACPGSNNNNSEEFVRLWDPLTGQAVQQTTEWSGEVQAVNFSPDGQLLAVGTRKRGVSLWELATWQPARAWSLDQEEVRTLAWSPSGRRLAVSDSEGAVTVWDPLGTVPRAPAAGPAWGNANRDRLWDELASTSAAEAFAAVNQFRERPTEALACLRGRVRPQAPVSADQLRQWLADLSHERFLTRQRATEELQRLEEMVLPDLLQALRTAPTAEGRRRMEWLREQLQDGRELSPDHRRLRRVVLLLEALDTPEARALLNELAQGAESGRSTQLARGALQRLERFRGK